MTERILPGPFRVAHAAARCVEGVTQAAAELLRERGTDPGPVSVDVRHAAAAFRSERQVLVDGRSPGDTWAPLSGDYRAADGWVKLHCNYPHHEAAVRAVLGDDVAAEVARRRAHDVAEAVLAAGGAAAMLRGRDEWREHPQGRAVAAEPLVSVERIADAPARPLPPADRPLVGVRVLDLTHVIAGPVCGRTLAAHGADVLHVGAAHLPTVRPLVIDTGFGKRTCHLDLRADENRVTLRELLADADVMVQSFRPDTFATKGFGPQDLPPGVVLVSLSAYGHSGPWRDRRGFDSLVQLATGIARESDGKLVSLPAQALDHGTGWLAAYGVIDALRRRSVEGGTWHVRVSLARTALWLDELGRVDSAEEPGFAEPYLSEMDSDFGLVRHVRFPGAMPGSPPGYGHGPRTPGGDPASWW
ncbi:CoA-transferase family III [Actinokineospora alba]|uniref:CoA-transferase family III n=1 Tax=Actinokineospora alba TaxID=504798 RepID=A0A1H0INW4_9PSEU|nr:CoA transferase [Actinokineospora alba]TDP70866.1 CoA transferase family III [Actinokineospora alba]SDI91269.1 CoA-transferase family III [Actinokineospora alba]SDO33072.1 CoA-transferase family III [Actinokineospora alba]